MQFEVPPHHHFAEPKLLFHPSRMADVDIHPLRGLISHGPYSSGIVPDPIRVATVAPSQDVQHLYSFMGELSSSFKPVEREGYLTSGLIPS